MKPKLVLCAIFCVLCSICVGQWSEPALVWQDTTGMDEARLLCTPGDTFWTAVMDEGWNGQTGWHRIQTAWSTGDSWPTSSTEAALRSSKEPITECEFLRKNHGLRPSSCGSGSGGRPAAFHISSAWS